MSLNAIHCWGVVTNSQDKANKIYKNLENEFSKSIVQKRYYQNEKVLRLNTWVSIRWVKPISQARGYRFHKVWLDSELSQEELILIAGTICYCKQCDIYYV